ncbi:tyrosine-type recombinase/integrase [Oscillibacter sp. GMB15532]|uniref:tyrosine-type recombinase/integrase n=1 Tax=Oscillibacter sp. GMB15532 TaxID=3230022 RepID=UPI0034DDFF94
MPSTRKRETKDGRAFYEIIVRRGRDKSALTSRWYVPEGWSQRAIDRELTTVAADFERRCNAGEVISRREQKNKAICEAQEAAKVLTLRQYGETVFMPAKAVTISENTRSNFQGYLDRSIYPALGDLKMPDITPANISALLLSIQAEKKAHATVIKCYTILHSLFKMAYMADAIPRNPMDKVERPKPRKDETQAPVEACSIDELRHILQCLEQEPLKWQALIRLLMDTGIRRGECCGLKWKDVDFQINTITVTGNLCYTPQKGIYLDTPKNGKPRVVDVDPAVMSILRTLRSEQADRAISAYVFTQDGSPEPMHPQSPTRYLKKFSERYGIPGLHPHKLRHSFASVAITNGADIASVSEKLGHSDKAVTLRMYTHADQDSIKRASQIFRDAIEKI